MLETQVLHEGGKNCHVLVRGALDGEIATPVVILRVKDLQTPCERLRLDVATFAIQEKLGLYLWWDEGGKDLILPLESRGSLKWDGAGSLPCPKKDWAGVIALSSFNFGIEPKARVKRFTLQLDLEKS